MLELRASQVKPPSTYRKSIRKEEYSRRGSAKRGSSALAAVLYRGPLTRGNSILSEGSIPPKHCARSRYGAAARMPNPRTNVHSYMSLLLSCLRTWALPARPNCPSLKALKQSQPRSKRLTAPKKIRRRRMIFFKLPTPVLISLVSSMLGCVLFAVFLFYSASQTADPQALVSLQAPLLLDPSVLLAKSVVLYDPADGHILFEKDAGAVRPLASLTKLMSADIVLQGDTHPSRPSVRKDVPEVRARSGVSSVTGSSVHITCPVATQRS